MKYTKKDVEQTIKILEKYPEYNGLLITEEEAKALRIVIALLKDCI